MNRFSRCFLSILLLFALSLGLIGCNSAPPQETYTPAEGDQVATLAAVGDIYLTKAVLKDIRMADTSFQYNSLFSGLIPALCRADVTIGNFEGTFSGSPYGEETGSQPDDLAVALADAGFDILQTANSYSLQAGMSGLERTRDLMLREGISPLGTYVTQQQRKKEQVLLLEVNGIRFAFIAFTKGLDGMSIPKGSEYCVNLLYRDYDTTYSKVDYDSMTRVLEAALSAKPDVIVAALHWGSENISEVSESQEEIADFLFHHGVDVILGSHSHIPGLIREQTVSTASGETKTVVAAYSLGDFCPAEPGEVNPSLVLHLEFTKSAETGRTMITDVSYTPTAAADLGEGRRMRFASMVIDEALALYEGNYYDSISHDIYEELIAAREELVSMVTPPSPEEETEK